MTDNYLALKEEASELAQQLFTNDIKKCASFTDRLLDTCAKAQDKDFLLIHLNKIGKGKQWLQKISQRVPRTNRGWIGNMPLNSVVIQECPVLPSAVKTLRSF